MYCPRCCQVITEQGLVQHSESFESAIAGGDRTTLQSFCGQKATAALSRGLADEAETWTFLSVLFEEDARRQLLAKLGFEDSLANSVKRVSSVGVAAAADHLASAAEALSLTADGESCRHHTKSMLAVQKWTYTSVVRLLHVPDAYCQCLGALYDELPSPAACNRVYQPVQHWMDPRQRQWCDIKQMCGCLCLISIWQATVMIVLFKF